jgi:hypothetical protein
MEHALLSKRSMKRSRSMLAGVAVLVAMAVVVEVARARPQQLDGATAEAFVAASRQTLSSRFPAPEVIADPGAEPPVAARPNPVASRPEPDEPDWGNPYDLLLHGIPLGPTHDMRQ